ncbi:hypothetical protein QEN19_003802 [Hanseniaspora menglaensis]
MVKIGLNTLYRGFKKYHNSLYKDLNDVQAATALLKRSPSMYFTCIIIFIIVGSLIYSMIFAEFDGADTPSCRSIYMYPSYAKLNDMDSFKHTRFASKYHLYLYREQGVDPEPISSSNEIMVDGIPVLFIPGNAGSFKQGRSIAAQAANYYYSKNNEILPLLDTKKNKQNLDFYTLDFNEDFTAFHGQTMLDQAEFVNDCIEFILSLYETSSKTIFKKYGPLPKSVIIVGHSMGGIVSRVLPLLKNYVPESVNSIVTLSSPHSLSPLTFDGDLLQIYKEIDKFWVSEFEDKTSFTYNNISLISITGGILDDVLPSDYTLLETVLNANEPLNNGFTVYTSGIPNVWTSIDHLAIVWCDQLRKVVAKMLLSIVDKDSSSKTVALQERMDIFRSVLLENSVFENQQLMLNTTTKDIVGTFDTNSIKFIGDSILFDSFSQKGEYKIPLDALKILNIWNLEITTSFETFKKVDFQLCDQNNACHQLFNYFKNIPNNKLETLEESTRNDAKHNKDLLLFNDVVSKFAYLKVTLLDKIDGEVAINKFNSDNNIKLSFTDLLFFGQKVSVNRNINLQQFNLFSSISANIALKLVVKSEFLDKNNYPLIKQYISEPYETKWHFVKSVSQTLPITTAKNAPYIPRRTNGDAIELKLFNNGNAIKSITIQIDWIYSLKLVIRRYRLSFATLPMTFISLIFLVQVREFVLNNNFIPLSRCLKVLCSFLIIWTPVLSAIIEIFLSSNSVKSLVNLIDCVRVNDNLFNNSYSQHQKNEFLGNGKFGTENIIIDYIVVILSMGLVLLLGTLLDCVENLIHWIKNKNLGNELENKVNVEKQSIIQVFTLGKILKFGFLILVVFFYVPYQLIFIALTVSQLFHVLYLFSTFNKMNKNVIEFNKTILLMMLLVLPVCIPIVVVFFHNFAVNWKTPFRSHHNVLAIFPIISLVFCLQNGMILKREKNFNFRVLCFLLGYIAFFTCIFGERNTYFIYHLFNLLSATLCISMF